MTGYGLWAPIDAITIGTAYFRPRNAMPRPSVNYHMLPRQCSAGRIDFRCPLQDKSIAGADYAVANTF